MSRARQHPSMNLKALRDRLLLQEDLNFLLTNRVPRMALTRLMGRFSRLRSPWLTRLSIAVWRLFTDLDLSDAKQQHFDSLHSCFTRELVQGARPYRTDPDELASPCDAIVGAMGQVEAGTLLQAKGFPYTLESLMGSAALAARYARHRYITLRLTSSMYHRFHAPCDLEVRRVTYISGDTWNVNPIALRRVRELFCKNERAVLEACTAQGQEALALVPVAAILVASIRLHFLNVLLHLGYGGPHAIDCAATLSKGQEMGWFEHGSTIIVFIPPAWEWAPGVEPGGRLRAGDALATRQAAG